MVNAIKKELKESDKPILIDASVGSGKSLIIANILLLLEKANMRALCLTLNSTLIKQNYDAYNLEGGNAGICCASLDRKDFTQNIIFASPHTVIQGIRNKQEIGGQPFQLIVIDEVQNLDFHNSSSMYMRILNHYSFIAQQEQYKFKIIGLSGTCYRGKSISIVGPNEFFKKKLCSINSHWLIERGYLTRPRFGLPASDSYDFSPVAVTHNGKFNSKELQSILDKKERLSGEIMKELISLVDPSEGGCFIFCSTVKHVEECMRSLPSNAAAITAKTPHDERKRILDAANAGEIKYLVNVATLLVGVDCPRFHIAAFLRPTESLVLYTQAIGRVLRLFPGKDEAIVLDFAGNLDRFSDFDDPIINEAIQPKEGEDQEYIIPCYTCSSLNKVTARRCCGMPEGKRCDHYFEWKNCYKCQTKNDSTARHCRQCDSELIDPNAKLKKHVATVELPIHTAEYWVMAQKGGFPIINARYFGFKNNFHECFYTNTQKSRNIAYSQFVRKHVKNASDWYMRMSDFRSMELMLKTGLKSPSSVVVIDNGDGTYKMVKKVFSEQAVNPSRILPTWEATLQGLSDHKKT